jgi:hypothetical protein
MAAGRIYAVLTGDIVDSSRLSENSAGSISRILERTGEWVKTHFQSAVQGPIDVFRGDSWQLVVSEPAQAIRIGLLFRVFLRAEYGIDSRVSIGFGEIDYLPLENISTGTGQAFTLSGQGLESHLKSARMNLIIPSLIGTLEGQGLEIITQLIDLQVGGWTKGQSQAVAGALIDLTQAEIAGSWQPEPVSQQAISQHLESAGWSRIKNALLYLEEVLSALYSPGVGL